MNKMMTMIAVATLSIAMCQAETKGFRDIIGDAANIQMDAETLRNDLKSGKLNEVVVKGDVAALAKHIEQLQKDFDVMDGNMKELTAERQKDWELAKEKVKLLTIVSDWKTTLAESGEIRKNRRMLEAHAQGIATRAAMLQRTMNRLDR